MDKTEKLRRFEEYFAILRARGIIKTQGDLASLIGVSNKSISAAKNGNETYLTESLLSKIDAAVNYYTAPATSEELERDMIPSSQLMQEQEHWQSSLNLWRHTTVRGWCHQSEEQTLQCRSQVTPCHRNIHPVLSSSARR